jgi:hypothetical protein
MLKVLITYHHRGKGILTYTAANKMPAAIYVLNQKENPLYYKHKVGIMKSFMFTLH